MKKTQSYFPKIIVCTLIFFVADQLLKSIAQLYLSKAFTLIPGLLSFRYEQNTGIAWSIPLPQMLTIVINILLLVVLPVFLVKNLKMEQRVSQLVVSSLLAGALGNLIDRLFRGYVIDYVAVGSFPVFNLADALITISIFLILIFYDKIIRNPKKPD